MPQGKRLLAFHRAPRIVPASDGVHAMKLLTALSAAFLLTAGSAYAAGCSSESVSVDTEMVVASIATTTDAATEPQSEPVVMEEAE